MGDWDGQLSWLQTPLAIPPAMPPARSMAAMVIRTELVGWWGRIVARSRPAMPAAMLMTTMLAGLWGLILMARSWPAMALGRRWGGETAGVDRSGDASPASAVANAAALTQSNSSVGADGIDGNADDNDWPTRVWDFSAGMNPGLKWITGYVEDGTTELLKYPCDMALLPTLPSRQTCGGVIPGQVRTP